MKTAPLNDELRAKEAKLLAILHDCGRVLVAFSGGVDSSYLLAAACRALGDKALAVTAVSQTYAGDELKQARAVAAQLGARHEIIETDELGIAGFSENPPDRCYHCKAELFGKLQEVAAARGCDAVCDANNVDDTGDFRPGRRAARELGVRSPLIEAGLDKAEIRTLSREAGLPTWDQPAMACLASRFPYGETITEPKLRRVEAAEKFLRDRGFLQVRVRSHEDMARIEAASEHVAALAEAPLRDELVATLKAAGFTYVALDLAGYRTGSMNATLDAATVAADTGAVPLDRGRIFGFE